MESKINDSGFYKHIIISSLVVILLSIYPVSVYVSNIQFYSIISGYVIGLLNAIAGYKLNTIALNKSVKSFMVIVFGGMGLRMILIALIILILLYFVKLDEISLVASVFFFYILFVTIELFHLHKNQLRIKNQELASANK
ncbi:MAG TPA: hypothetical protein VJ455_04700 [Ignavibacteria bacterium]|nr:hypothetical protein [Ignavibacteria bacterium]